MCIASLIIITEAGIW